MAKPKKPPAAAKLRTVAEDREEDRAAALLRTARMFVAANRTIPSQILTALATCASYWRNGPNVPPQVTEGVRKWFAAKNSVDV